MAVDNTNKFKQLRKGTGTITLIFFEFILLYVISGLFLPYIAVNKHTEDTDEVSIYIFSNGVHTDLVLPIKNSTMDWSQVIKFEHTTGKDSTANFIAFGWGDKGFYLETPTWSDLKISTAFKAAFALSESAIHTTFFSEMSEGSNCIKINISENNYKKLVQYIYNSFETDVNNQPINIHTTAVYGTNDTFYEGAGTYSLFYTCNTWANNGLKACKQKAGLWALLEGGIFYHYRQ